MMMTGKEALPGNKSSLRACCHTLRISLQMRGNVGMAQVGYQYVTEHAHRSHACRSSHEVSALPHTHKMEHVGMGVNNVLMQFTAEGIKVLS
jgi:hypothetical protein